MTQLESALKGQLTPEIRECAHAEGIEPDVLLRLVSEGLVAIPANKLRPASRKPYAVGRSCRPKVNANIGTSRDICDHERELAKLKIAEQAGAEAVMDLSTGGDLREIRRRLLEQTTVLFGSVPIYEAAVKATNDGRRVVEMSPADMLDAVRMHAEDGVDFATIHAGVTLHSAAALAISKRICGVVSRGGTMLVEWMRHNNQENPLYEHFDEVLQIAREYDMTISLGDGFRPGALHDAFDAGQVAELTILGELVLRCREAGVQAIVEGPGHVPLDQVEAQVLAAKQLTFGAPLYLLGPLVTDVAPGYDHITAAIGAANAVMAGADFICYVTPAEHLRLPLEEDVREGVIAARIAVHAGHVARDGQRVRRWDDEISTFRRNRQWDEVIACSMSPADAQRVRNEGPPIDESTCSMCGDLCVFKLADDH